MILNEIANKTRKRVEALKRQKTMDDLIKEVSDLASDASFPFENALKAPGISFICEVKKASPSKGVLDEEFDYLSIASDYEEAGASAVSVLTEPFFFSGCDRFLSDIASSSGIPVLRKDFIIDSYQIYQSKLLGASAVLLICALLDTAMIKSFIETADTLGISALVEVHDEEETEKALNAGARIIGVNNRDLKTFGVDISTSVRLRSLVPGNVLFVSESGIKTPGHIKTLRDIKADGVLIGEALMLSPDKKAALALLKGAGSM